ncbi:MAG: hypothetical protein KGJ78_09645 [Alphaproteobacteria bacterium]|nr:hypothetical protein [Alphaproteobacteria bacterium]
MNLWSKSLVVGAVLGAALAAAPAQAGVNFSIGIGVPAYYGYDYYRPCDWYRWHDYPAPRRCYAYYRGYWGPSMYVDGDFIFRDRDDWYRWRDRDDYRHWRGHDWRDRDRGDRDRGDRGWHDRGRGHDHGWRGHDQD